MSRLSDFMTIIAWNIYVGTGAKAARQALKSFIKSYRPEIIGLMEAANLYGDLEHLGYEVIQLRSRPRRKGNLPGQGNIAIMVRNDIKIVKRRAMRMRTFWRGPKHGWAQDPRVYRAVWVEFNGRIWKIAVAHTPFGTAARLESARRLTRWLQRTLPGRPTVLVLDANMRLPEFRKTIGRPGGTKSSASGIEIEAHKNCHLFNSELLEKGPSDHHAKLYEFAAGRRKRRKA